jgi:xanthine dehydrogenase YagR molybdenum-binding subunit
MSTSVGGWISRKDGRLKVTGQAPYAADHRIAAVAHAVAIQSTIASGRITTIDSSRAEKAPGVLAIIHHGNAPKLYRPANDFMSASKPGEGRVVFEDDRVHYSGQYVAIVVAETLEQARYAADLVQISYAVEDPIIETEAALDTAYLPDEFFGEKLATRRGDPEEALSRAAVTHQASYTTPIEHHNPIEPSASIAAWNGDELTLYETTQWVAGARKTVAETLGIPEQKIHIVSPFIGGGFGCKGFVWPHSVLSAIAARKVNRPVKLNLTRKQMFSACGHRSETRQHVQLGADRDGRLVAIDHDTVVQTSTVDEFVEACGNTSRFLYSCPNIRVRHQAVRVNIATPTPMRAPGENPGLFALESALDELAHTLKMDPVELRIINHADVNEQSGKPWSSKYLKECYRMAAERFGWARRDPRPGSMRDGNLLVGWGMATATYPGIRSPGAAKVRLLQDGSVEVISATQDMGGGTYTTMAQIVADVMGVSIDRIRTFLGDSLLPPAPVSGGSMTTVSILPAVRKAAQDALSRLRQLAATMPASPFTNRRPDDILAEGGRILPNGTDRSSGLAYEEVLKRTNRPAVEGEGYTGPGRERDKYAFQSFGAQFVEVKVDPEIARVQVSRVVSAFDVGKIINAKTARSQGYSGVIMGIGMALMEHTVYDSRDGSVVTSNLADYAIPVNADAHSIDILFVDKPDPFIDSDGLGARGVGEITATGVAPAVANAVYHATGRRIRDLPITPDKLLSGPV